METFNIQNFLDAECQFLFRYERKKSVLFIVRGISGSGKTTFAKALGERVDSGICEADDFFIRPNGVYDFNPRFLKDAHQYCFDRVSDDLARKKCAIVSNTATRLWEMEKYFELAKSRDAELFIFRMVSQYENTHGVPKEKVAEMAARFEDAPFEIKINKYE